MPAIAIQLAKSPEVDNYDLSCVREIVCGTAPLHHKVEKLLRQRFPGLILRQGKSADFYLLRTKHRAPVVVDRNSYVK